MLFYERKVQWRAYTATEKNRTGLVYKFLKQKNIFGSSILNGFCYNRN